MSNNRKSTPSNKRLSVGAAGNKSNQAIGSSGANGIHSTKQGPKMKSHSRGKDVAKTVQSPQNEAVSNGTGFAKVSSKPKSYDPARISQWAVNSATSLQDVPAFRSLDLNTLVCGPAVESSTATIQVSGDFPFAQNDAVHTSCYANTTRQTQDFDVDPSISEVAHTGIVPARSIMDHDLLQNQNFDFPPVFPTDEDFCAEFAFQADSQTHQPSHYDAFLSSDPLAPHPFMMQNNIDSGHTMPVSCDFHEGHDFSGPVMFSGSHSMDISPYIQCTPSTSSLHSQSSFLGPQPNTPVSAATCNDSWAIDSMSPLNEEYGLLPGFQLGDSMNMSSTANYVETEDIQSTLRPNQNFSRPSLPTAEMWRGQDVASPAFGVPMYPGMDGSRRSSEGEVRSARDHPLYKAGPKEDGLYHCPYALTENCQHKPEKLKCNYDKHLDSHLKPYRCKSIACQQVQFSSTACLLRHEREAHAMHGHGAKPHLCYFKDCERAQEDNGFPRRWNLFDHMKRVHDFEPSTKGNSLSNKSNSPPPSQSPSPEATGDPIKKKRTPSPAEGPAKRAKIEATTEAGSTIRSSRTQPVFQGWLPQTLNDDVAAQGRNPRSLNDVWNGHVSRMQARMNTMNPTDPVAMEQYNADYKILQSIHQSIRMQQAQLAH